MRPDHHTQTNVPTNIMANPDKKKSKLLSLVLRHRPELIGITLDDAGWTSVSGLLGALEKFGEPLSREELNGLVETSDKKRFALDPANDLIRANQGHSVSIDLALSPTEPPAILYHGTALRFLESIQREGLLKGERHHVHLHTDRKLATAVGGRHGKPVILIVDAAAMHADGATFYVTANNVWLTETVPPSCLSVG